MKKSRSKRKKKSWSRSSLKKKGFKTKLKKLAGIFVGILFVCIFIGTIFVLSIVAKYSSELPNPDEPFERGQDLTSYVVDRNGKELYKIHGDENREIAKLEEIPLDVQWAFLAAEDVDFYTHKGIDAGGITKALLYECCKIGSPRGGSTITQQMIKNTVLTNERSYERKIKEIILSLRIEQKYNKDEVLQLYLNEIGFGGNTYGLKTASRVYFGKEVKDLTLGEAALLAGLPNAPGLYSPLFASDLTSARELSVQRQKVILDQMLDKKELINAYAKKYSEYEGEEEFITEELINEAREQKLVYKSGKINIKAPHFVFYVQNELQNGNYNKGRPFTISEIERGGLKITTSLDLDLQNIAEQAVKDGLEAYAKPHGANNVSLVNIDPNTGQILSMVGSADYFGSPYPEGCTLGLDCKFEPKVNVSTALRQPGSSLKPMVALTGFETGQLYPASFIPDIPITFANGYEPKNNEGGFMSNVRDLRTAMRFSRNIPFVQGIEIVGVTQFLNTLEKLGYSTFTQPENYGPALALGAGDVTLVEHTNGYATVATLGVHHPISPILKVEDKEGNVLYDYNEDEAREGVRVVDERAAYLVTDVTNASINYQITPPAGYSYSGKTGTSDNNKNVFYMGYSPNYVTGVWAGNNDNSSMYGSAFGYTVARPIWMSYTERVIGRFDPGVFTRPGGIVSASVCKAGGLLADEDNPCEKQTDLFIQGKLPPKDTFHETYRVCKDQKNKLARDIDEELGFAVDKVYKYLEAPKPEWQPYWDKAFNQEEPPTEYCTKNRNPSGEKKPWVEISSPNDGVYANPGEELLVEATGYSSDYDVESIEIYIDDTYITQAGNNPLAQKITIPETLSNGTHTLTVKAIDSVGQEGIASITVIIGDVVSITSPASGQEVTVDAPVSVVLQYNGPTGVSGSEFVVTRPDTTTETYEMIAGSDGEYQGTFVPEAEGEYQIRANATLSNGEVVNSQLVTITCLTDENGGEEE